MHLEGFGGRCGFGRRPALVIIDMTLGFTDPESPQACDLEEPVANIRKLLEAARLAKIPIAFTTVAYRASVDGVLGYLEKVNQASGARTQRLPLPARNIESASLGLLQYAQGGV